MARSRSDRRAPAASRQAASTRFTPIALLANGTVREARGFASITDTRPSRTASWTLTSPTTPSAGASVVTISSISSRTSLVQPGGGRTQLESPEWTPASSTCCMTAATNVSRAVAERVDVELERALQEPVDEDARPPAGRSPRPSRRRSRRPSGARRARTRDGRAPGSRSARRRRSPPPACSPSPTPAPRSRARGRARRSARGPRRGRRRRTACRGSGSRPPRCARASLSGVWPPNWITTPTGCSRSQIASTSSTPSGSK